MIRRDRLAGMLATIALVMALSAVRSAIATDADEAGQQSGAFIHMQTPSVLPGPKHTLADGKRALQTYEAVVHAYASTPLLDPPRGFEVVSNYNADAREAPSGWPIPVSGALILLRFDTHQRLASGRYAAEGEGPSLGAISINSLDCGLMTADPLGSDVQGEFYAAPVQTDSIKGWPAFDVPWGTAVFLSRRTQPRLIPVSVERLLRAQLSAARQEGAAAASTDSLRPKNAYQQWLSGHDARLRDYQKTRDQMAATNRAQADQFYANMLNVEEQTGKTLQSVAANGAAINGQIDAAQATSAAHLHDLEQRLAQLSPAERAQPAYVYEALDGSNPVGTLVAAGTPGSRPAVALNPDFFDHTLPAWEAQSICVRRGGGPNTQRDRLYPTILAIWQALDWDAMASQLH